MTGPEVLGPFRLPESVRAHLGAAEFASLWTAVSARLERNGLSPTGAVQLELDDAAAAALSGLLGRTVTAGVVRVRLAELDSALRSSRAAGGLVAVVEALTGHLNDRRRARQAAADGRVTLWTQVDALLAGSGLVAAWWVPDWVAQMRRSGILTRAGDRAIIEVSTAVDALRLLAETSFPQMASTSKAWVSESCPVEWELGALATKASGWDAHALDADRTASDLVLRAAARVMKKDPARTAADRRDLWTSIGVSPDLLSGTVLVWKLPWRMRAVDYRAAIAGLPADRRRTLTGRPVATPWDPGLAAAMEAAGVAIHEESLLPDLLSDLH